jgi:hypothetical protein
LHRITREHVEAFIALKIKNGFPALRFQEVHDR